MDDGRGFVDRLVRAVNAHNIEALVGCFATEYVNETPAHPARSFRGRDQVRRNWEQIFAFVPDIHVAVPRCTVGDDAVWSEWEMSGSRRDGTSHRMRGTVLFGVSGG